MTVRLPADTMPGLDAVTDADRKWFAAHPHRRYRLRPTAIAELMLGEVIGPGSHTVVVPCGSPLVRMRFRVGRPPSRLRQNTDRCCRALIRCLDEAGYTLNGKRVLAVIKEMKLVLAEIAA
jgi:hypothetical protein